MGRWSRTWTALLDHTIGSTQDPLAVPGVGERSVIDAGTASGLERRAWPKCEPHRIGTSTSSSHRVSEGDERKDQSDYMPWTPAHALDRSLPMRIRSASLQAEACCMHGRGGVDRPLGQNEGMLADMMKIDRLIDDDDVAVPEWCLAVGIVARCHGWCGDSH